MQVISQHRTPDSVISLVQTGTRYFVQERTADVTVYWTPSGYSHIEPPVFAMYPSRADAKRKYRAVVKSRTVTNVTKVTF